MYQHIVVITDQDNIFTLALEKANDVAKQFNAVVDVISFVNISESDINITEHTQKVNEHVHNIFDNTLTVHTHIADTENISRWIAHYCDNHPVDLVIKTGRRSESIFYTPCDWQLIRQLKCSLLILSDRKWRAKANILAAVDAGCKSERQQAMDQQLVLEAQQWSKIHDSELHVAYAVPLPAVALEFGMIELEQYERENGDKAREAVQQFIDNTGIDNIDGHYSFGPADKRIPSTANKIKADLVVVGSVCRTGVNAMLLGNTAEKILHQLRTDILIVKPE